MISVVIATDNSAPLLAPTLAALVAGAVAGVVREVIVADTGSQDATTELAEMAGCRVVVSTAPESERLRAAAALARSDWLMFLRPGSVPDGDWIGALEGFLRAAGSRSRGALPIGVFTCRAEPTTAVGDLMAALRGLAGFTPLSRCLVLRKDSYARLGGHRAVTDCDRDLIRRAGRGGRIVLAAPVTDLAAVSRS